MEELVQRVASAAGIKPDTAEAAIGMIFAFLKKEAPAANVDSLLSELPGAQEAAAKAEDGGAGFGGILAGLAGAIGGGGLIGLAGQLSGLGLGMTEMTVIGKQVFAFAREKVGDERVGQIVAAVPGLSQFV